MQSLSRSNTRITVLEYCQRKYFFNYYSDGLKSQHPDLWKQTKVLRKLKSLEMRMGEMTHKILSLYLIQLKNHITAHSPQPDTSSIIQKISQEMTTTFEESEKTDYEDFVNFGLSEHYYQENQENALESVIKKVVSNLEAFIASEYHQRIIQRFRKGHHIYIEDPQHTNFEQMKVDTQHIPGLEEISILASPDFGMMFGDHNYLILDWKSGKENLDGGDITDQLRVYALKVLLKQKSSSIGDIHIDVHEVYLPSLQAKTGTIQQQDIDSIIKKIKEDTDYQKQFLVDQDAYKNQALPYSNFSKTAHEKKCASCTFRAVCQKLS